MGWSNIRALAHRYGFTETEAKAVLLIVTAALAGALLGGTTEEREGRPFTEEYRHMDSLFTARSAQASEVNTLPDSQMEPVAIIPGRIDINAAPANELEALPGIGPVIAQRIIEYREKHGGFQKPDDLIKVKSIGNKKFQLIEPYICIGE